MQDRFKFRVWDDVNNKYVEKGVLLRCGELATPSMKNDYDINPTDGRYSIEQCTGLTDKNGRLIYEGDIVAKQFSNKPFSSKAKYKIKNCLVYWQESGQFSIEYHGDDYRYYSASHDSFIGECEVIGNVHENLELMEE